MVTREALGDMLGDAVPRTAGDCIYVAVVVFNAGLAVVRGAQGDAESAILYGTVALMVLLLMLSGHAASSSADLAEQAVEDFSDTLDEVAEWRQASMDAYVALRHGRASEAEAHLRAFFERKGLM